MVAQVVAGAVGRFVLSRAIAGTASQAALADVGSSAATSAEQIGRLVRVLTILREVSPAAGTALGQTAATIDILRESGKAAGKALASLLGIFQGRELSDLSRQWQALSDELVLVRRRLAQVIEEGEGVNELFEKLVQRAQRARAPVIAFSRSFIQMRRALGAIPGAAESTGKLTERLTKAAILAGQRGNEASQGVQTFAQAISDGQVSASEFAAIVARLPVAAEAVAKGLNQIGVTSSATTKEVQRLAAEGRLSAGLLVAAFTTAGSEIDEQFAKLPKTVEESLTGIKNEFVKIFNRINSRENITASFRDSFKILKGSLKNLVPFGAEVVRIFGELSKISTIIIRMFSYLAPLLMPVLKIARLLLHAFASLLQLIGRLTSGIASFIRDQLAKLVPFLEEMGARVAKIFGPIIKPIRDISDYISTLVKGGLNRLSKLFGSDDARRELNAMAQSLETQIKGWQRLNGVLDQTNGQLKLLSANQAEALRVKLGEDVDKAKQLVQIRRLALVDDIEERVTDFKIAHPFRQIKFSIAQALGPLFASRSPALAPATFSISGQIAQAVSSTKEQENEVKEIITEFESKKISIDKFLKSLTDIANNGNTFARNILLSLRGVIGDYEKALDTLENAENAQRTFNEKLQERHERLVRLAKRIRNLTIETQLAKDAIDRIREIGLDKLKSLDPTERSALREKVEFASVQVDRQRTAIRELSASKLEGEIARLAQQDLISESQFQKLSRLVAELKSGKRSVGEFASAVRALVGDGEPLDLLLKVLAPSAGRLRKLRKESERYKAALAVLAGTATKAQLALLKLGDSGDALKKLVDEFDPLGKRLEDLKKKREELQKALESGMLDGAFQERAQRALTALDNQITQTETRLKPVSGDDFLRSTKEALNNKLQLLSLSKEERDIEQEMARLRQQAAQRRIVLTEEQEARLRNLVTQYIRMKGAIEKATQAQQKLLDQARQLAESIGKSLRSAFQDAVKGLLDGSLKGFKSFGKKLVDTVRSAIAQALVTRFFQPIIDDVAKDFKEFFGDILRTDKGKPLPPAPESLSGFAILSETAQEINKSAKNLTKASQDLTNPSSQNILPGDQPPVNRKSEEEEALKKQQSKFAEIVAGALRGAAVAGLPGLFGVKTSKTGGAIGGALGQLVGGKLGSIIGGLVGSLIGGAFKKTPQASVALVGGRRNTPFTRGGAQAETADRLQSSVLDALDRIAADLGGVVTDVAFGVIGQRGKRFFFNPTATTPDKNTGKAKFGAQVFATGEGAALAAIKEAIRDGVIVGLSETAKTIAANSRATTPDQFLADLQFAKVFDELVNLGKPTSDFVKRIKDLNRRFAQAISKAHALGLAEEELAKARERALRQIKEEFDRSVELAILEITDPVRAALEKQKDEARQFLLDAVAAGADMEQALRKVRLDREQLIDELEQNANAAIEAFKKSIRDFIDELRFGDRSRLAERERLPILFARFQELAEKAKTDEEARNQLQDLADKILKSGEEVFASSSAFFTLQDRVIAILEEVANGIETVDVRKIADEVGKIELDPEFQRLMADIGQEIAASNEQVIDLLAQIRDRLPGNGGAQPGHPAIGGAGGMPATVVGGGGVGFVGGGTFRRVRVA